jgi:hypothetical protein
MPPDAFTYVNGTCGTQCVDGVADSFLQKQSLPPDAFTCVNEKCGTQQIDGVADSFLQKQSLPPDAFTCVNASCLQLCVPVQKVHPTVVQMVGREFAAHVTQLFGTGLARRFAQGKARAMQRL